MVNYTCPKCGQPMQCIVTATIPAISRYECYGCGYRSKSEMEEPIYMVLPKELLRGEEKDVANDQV